MALPTQSEVLALLPYLTPQERAELDRLLAIPSDDWRTLVRPRIPHAKQRLFIDSPAKRKVIRAGRRGGKTTGIGILAVEAFKQGRRILYGAPTEDQVATFWWEVLQAFQPAIDAGFVYKNETKHILEIPDTKIRIRAKTAWNADTLRGDYADLLILDEWQLMNEDAWERVGAPMLLDNDGDAVFIYTPPSLHSRSATKARDPQHAANLFKKAKADDTGRWEAFHFSSHDNPYISREALEEITTDMTALAYEQEILALDKDETPGALWTRDMIVSNRVTQLPPDLSRVVVGVDPTGSATNECGIVVAGSDMRGHGYVLDDRSLLGSPGAWANAAIDAYFEWEADAIVVETNYGGDMVKNTIRTAERGGEVVIRTVRATRGKAVRAEPIASKYERELVHHVGPFPVLENELCNWVPDSGMRSPNRLDAAVWALSALLLKEVRAATSHQG